MAPFYFAGHPMSELTGPWVLGFLWSHLLYGILIVQMYIYYVHFPKDPRGIKFTAAFLFLLETLFTLSCNVLAFKTLGSGWGNTDVLLVLDWSWLTTPPLTGLTELTVQTFFVWRIWKLTGKLWICVLIQSISLASVTSVFYFGVKFIQAPFLQKLFEQSTAIVVWLCTAACCDILITMTMVIHLYRAKRQTSYKHTAATLNKLMTWTVETGMLTAIMAVLDLSFWLADPTLNYHFIWYLTIARIYANTLMATLNSRALMRIERGNEGSNSTSGYFGASTPSGLWSDTANTGNQQSGIRFSPPIALTVTSQSSTYVETVPGPTTPVKPENDPKAIELLGMN